MQNGNAANGNISKIDLNLLKNKLDTLRLEFSMTVD